MELRHAILGLLSIRPLSGYDLGRAFEGSVQHFWHADQSQIYRTLERLSRDGAITTERIAQDTRPDRKVHALTDDGRAELDAWLRSPLDQERPKEPFLARLFFAESLGSDGIARLLDERAAAADEVLRTLRGLEAAGGMSAVQAATLQHGIAHATTELAWIAATRESLIGQGSRA